MSSTEEIFTPNAIFQVWNPLYEPSVIYEHARVMKESKNGTALWGKIGRHIDEQNPEREAEMLGLAAGGRSCTLFITDYNTLHLCNVIRIERAPELLVHPAGVPAYYAGRRVAYWFTLSDIILVSGEHLETLTLLEHLKRPHFFQEGELQGLCPYAERNYSYPMAVQVDPATVQEWRKNGSPAQDNYGLPGPVLDARQKIGRILSAGALNALPDKVMIRLAEGHLHYGQQKNYRPGNRDYGLGVFSLAMAYENLLWDHLAPTLCELQRMSKLPSIRIKPNEWAPEQSLEDICRNPKILPTLNAFGLVFKAVAFDRKLTDYAAALGGVDGFIFKTLAANAFFKNYLTLLRNKAAHRQSITEAEAHEFYRLTFKEKYITKLNERIVKLKKKLQESH